MNAKKEYDIDFETAQILAEKCNNLTFQLEGKALGLRDVEQLENERRELKKLRIQMLGLTLIQGGKQ